MEPHFLGIGLDPKNLVTSFGAGIGSQKGDEQFARLNVTPFRKMDFWQLRLSDQKWCEE